MKLLLFPLNAELKAFVAALESKGFKGVKNNFKNLPVFEFTDLDLRCALGGHGKVQFAIQTQFFLTEFKDSSVVFCIGTAGSLSKAEPLDVVIASEVIEHDYNLRFVKKDKPKFFCDKKWLETFSKVKVENFRVYQGSIASGDEDILSEVRASEVYKETQALAVAWEGAGAARVCKFLNVPYLEIRAVSDFADESAARDFQKFMSRSMANIVELILQAAKV